MTLHDHPAPRLPIRATPVPRHQVLRDLPPDASYLLFSPFDRSDWPGEVPGETNTALDILGNVGIIKVSATDPGSHLTGLGWLDTSVASPESTRTIHLITSDTTIDATYDLIKVDASGGNVTITLPAAATNASQFDTKKIDSTANTVTIAAASGEEIEYDTTAVLTVQGENIRFSSDLTTWCIL